MHLSLLTGKKLADWLGEAKEVLFEVTGADLWTIEVKYPWRMIFHVDYIFSRITMISNIGTFNSPLSLADGSGTL
jgi:hypothetical protein